MPMNPETIKARMIARVAMGEYPTQEAWCRAVLKSMDPKVPREFKLFAALHLARTFASRTPQTGPQWALALRVRHMQGEALCQAQIDSYRLALYGPGKVEPVGEADESNA